MTLTGIENGAGPIAPGPAGIDALARETLKGNDKGRYTIPTAGLYPYQWNWDSAFAASGFSTFDTDRAWTELETLLSGQWPSGMVPHILFHADDPGYFPGPEVWGTDGLGPVRASGISQPPVAASLARAIHERDAAAGSGSAASAGRLRRIYGRLLDWHRWFMRWRCQDGAIFATHPWESGRDNSPDWDCAMASIDPVGVGDYTRRDTSHVDPEMRPTKADYDRYVWLVQRGRRLGWDDAAMDEDPPFRVADPGLTFILLRAHRDLAALSGAVAASGAGEESRAPGEDGLVPQPGGAPGRPAETGRDLAAERSEIDGWIAELEAGAERLRGADGLFRAANLLTGRPAESLTSASFLNWYAGVESAEMLAALDEAFERCRYPVPSLAVDAPEFDGKRYWRGPTWAIMNSLIARGLGEMGHCARAARLREVTAGLIERHGFAEYFHPMTGEPAGGGKFTWTAAVWLAWASPSAGEA